MTRSIAIGAEIAALAAKALPAAAYASTRAPKPCGAINGPSVRIAGSAFSRYSVYGIGIDCGFAKKTIHAILSRRLPNSRTPVKAKGASGWICIAQEVDRHVTVAGHCQRGRSQALRLGRRRLPSMTA